MGHRWSVVCIPMSWTFNHRMIYIAQYRWPILRYFPFLWLSPGCSLVEDFMTLFLVWTYGLSVPGAGALWPSFWNQAWPLNGDKWGLYVLSGMQREEQSGVILVQLIMSTCTWLERTCFNFLLLWQKQIEEKVRCDSGFKEGCGVLWKSLAEKQKVTGTEYSLFSQ